jgi:GNAT superfamily N-acetyltransferase
VHKAVALDTVFRRQAQGLYDPLLKTGTMPVYVENLSLASPQDRRDLELIYADAPEWLLTPYPQASALIDAALANQCLLVGRFNGRLLGAARLERLADRWRLTHLCVRELTRGRGVAQRLLDEARRLAREADVPLVLAANPGQTAAQRLAAHHQLSLEAL